MLNYRLLLISIFALLFSACTGLKPVQAPDATGASEQPDDVQASAIDLDEILPFDPNVRTGTLENGITYFVRNNTEPQDRAELWLAVNAGSVLEDDDQLGLAHFLEHMMFNGTEHFPGMGVVDFLESVGMEFGPDVNAYTSFDETVYTIQVPTGDAETIDQGFQVLEDWAHAATIEPDAVEQERGVIVEEWRLDQESAAGRIQEQTLPAILGDSHYTDRLPIGDMDIVRSAPAETLRRYYETWYRPDLMAVIAVGDFEDLDQVEAMIQSHFGSLSSPETAQLRPSHTIPEHDDTQFLVVTDPEETTTELQIWRKQEVAPLHTGANYRDQLVRSLYYSILDERFGDLERKPDAPFLSVNTGSGNYVRPVDVDVVFAQVEESKVESGLDAIMTELERVKRHGFTESELARAKESLLDLYSNSFNERNNRDSARLADEYVAYFLTGEASPGIEFEYELVQQLLAGIVLDDVNAIGADLVAEDNRVVILTGPQKDDLELPTEQDLAAVVDQVMAKEIDPLEEQLFADELMEARPEPVAIVAENSLPEVGITEIVLENGVRVLLKPTGFKDDEVLFSGFSLGGTSLTPDEDFADADTIVDVVLESGVGQLNQSDLEKFLTGKSVSVTPYLRELTEGLEGSSSVKDLETLFQLIYLYVTQPRADADAFQVLRTQMRADLANRALSPDAALRDTLIESLYGDSVRRGDLSLEDVDGLDLARGFEIYRDRFADMDDAVFAFVGSFDADELKSLAQSYLGNLPSTDREETWQDVAPDLPTDVVEQDVFKGEGEQSIVQMFFLSAYEPSVQNDVKLQALASVLDILVREKLREELGGVYASGVSAWSNELPDANSFVAIVFGSEPARVEELVSAALQEVTDLQENGPSAENLEKAKAIAKSANQESLEQNGYWLDAIKNAQIYPGKKVEDLLILDSVIDSLAAEDIQQAARDYVNPSRHVKVALFPESFQDGASE